MNREKVIDAFKERISSCSIFGDGFDVTLNWKLADDILALLKEQEPVKVKDYADIVDGIQVGYCPKCDRKIVWNPEKEETVAFCKYCGQAVKWE